jgi:hypothetical protein
MEKSRGIALVSALLLTGLAALLALTGFQSARTGEQAAGANRASASALMAAEYGASLAIEEVDSGNRDFSGSGNVEENGQFGVLRYEYSAEDIGGDFVRVVASGFAGDQISRQLAVIIELRNLGEPVDFGDLSPINLPGPIGDFTVPQSDSFLVEGVVEDNVDGGSRPAIAVNSDAEADRLRGLIEGVNREGNYDGGIEAVLAPPSDGEEGGSILSHPDKFKEFLEQLKTFAGAANNPYGQVVQSVDTTGPQDSRTNLGTVDNPMITFVENDLTLQGQASGAGILVVEGSYGTGGTPQFNGLVIVLGDTFGISGGGNGGLNGALILAPMDEVVDLDTDEISTVYKEADIVAGSNKNANQGGGGASYSYNAGMLSMAFDMMPEYLRDFWNSNNESIYQDGEVDKLIASWREV